MRGRSLALRLRFRGVLIGISILVWAPHTALALSVVPDPATFEITSGALAGTKGEFDFLGMVTGLPSGGVVLDGAVSASDVTLVFTASMDPTTTNELPGTELFDPFPITSPYTMVGVGTVPNGGVDVTSGTVQNPTESLFQFDGGSGVLAGQTSDAFFVSFSSGSLVVGDEIGFGFVIQDVELVTVTVAAPEPSVVALLALTSIPLGRRIARARR